MWATLLQRCPHVHSRGVRAIIRASIEVAPGGVAIDTTISAGGTEGIQDGGVASGLAILSGGTLALEGYESTFTIASDGTLEGDAGGASTFTIASGGTLVVGALDQLRNPFPVTCTLAGYAVSAGVTFWLGVQGGAVSTTVLSGGEVINWDGVASGTTVSSGGTLFQSSGVASGTTISSGGTFILDGGVASGKSYCLRQSAKPPYA